MKKIILTALLITGTLVTFAQKKPKDDASFAEKVMYVEKSLEKDHELAAIKGDAAGAVGELKYNSTYSVEPGQKAYVIMGSSPASFAPKTTYEIVLFENADADMVKNKWAEYKKMLQEAAAKKWKDQNWQKNTYEKFVDDFKIRKADDDRYEIQLILEPTANSKSMQVRLTIIVY